MTPVIPWSMTNISLIHGATFTLNKNNHFTRCSLSRKPVKRTSCSQKLVLPVPSFAASFPQSGLLRRSIRLKVSATGTDITVAEPDFLVLDEGSSGASETTADAGEIAETLPVKSDANPALAQSRRARPARKSEMSPVKNEDLVPGAMFTGKVRSIQPFGAFVDFGAFTDGLVHVSQLSDNFVKDVGSVVSIGQEVQVRLVEANTETGRISLSMRARDDPAKMQQQDTPATASGDKPRPARRNTTRSNQRREEANSSKFLKGQELQGTVKNLTRSGAFISLPEGEEGFLPSSEESDGGLGSMLGGSSLEVGQEVSVCVLRLSRGQVTLTMKKEEDEEKLDTEFSQGVIHAAINPFVLAFRQNKDIAAFLDDREKVEEPKKKASEEVGSPANQREVLSDVPEVQEQPAGSDAESIGASTEAAFADVNADSETTLSEEKEEDSYAVLDLEGSASTVGESIVETPSTDLAKKIDKSDLSGEIASQASSVESSVTGEIVENQPTAGDEISSAASVEKDDAGSTSDKNGSIIGSDVLEDSVSPQEAKDEEENVESTAASVDSSDATVLSSESQAVEEIEKQVETTMDDAQIQTPAAETESVYEKEAVEEVVADQVEDIHEQVQVQTPTAETETVLEKEAVEEVVTDQVADIKEEVPVQTPAAETETTSSEKQAVEEIVENQVKDTKEVQIQTPAIENGTPEKVESTPENATKATISPALVKQLREETGAGMMDCKKALSETGGDIVKAQEYLRKKGLASAEKKASRATAEGRIGSYIHDSRIGVLVEVNCETDFVSRGEIFKELVDDIAMQVAACPQVQYLATEDVPEEFVNKEREIEMQKEDLASKPEQIRAKIVEGRIRKRLEELALLEQPYIKNDKVVIKDWVKQTIATIGENIKVKRYIRYNLGEGLEKKSKDFAAEVAAQTAAKPAPAPVNKQPAAPEVKETEEKKPAVAVSAALVKKLREETGAGMMDCKKALSETGGDLEKAQEYLRKKGLSTADKKSSRLAAEGRIGAYIHDSRIGVLIEINCETDFVGRSENFKALVDDLAMQVVACPQVQFVSIEDIPEEIVKKEKELEMQREDLASKPENIRERIVEARVSKRLGELTLLEQPFIKNDSILVKDLVKQTVAALGENIKVRRFVRFTLGETTEGEKAEKES